MAKGIELGTGRGPWGTDISIGLPAQKAGGPVPILYYDTFKKYLF